MLPCSFCSNSAWEALWALASLMAIEHAALFSCMEHAWVILASLTISKQMALASRVVQEQMALASLMVVQSTKPEHPDWPGSRWLWLL